IVSAIQAIEPRIVAQQIRLCCEAFPVAAIKTGMLFSREIIGAVCDALEDAMNRVEQKPALVVDPVMVATSGDALLEKDAVALYRERLFPMADVVTPNLDEVATLLGRKITNVEEMRIAGEELAETYQTAFLIKGGHLRASEAVDLLIAPGSAHEFRAPFVANVSTHGTGCTYSAAIAAGLARGLELPAAVGEAKRYLTNAIVHFQRWDGRAGTTDALHHFAPRA
ncbi:MAG: bifunctional hydroxymethylpyrimidine kinase/phosphomethylpyrimidine kinase, partial [Chthoniobacteraceae bacterium]